MSPCATSYSMLSSRWIAWFPCVNIKYIYPRFCSNRFFAEQLETMLTLKNFNGSSSLAVAAASGDKATFESVWTTVQDKLSPEQVK